MTWRPKYLNYSLNYLVKYLVKDFVKYLVKYLVHSKPGIEVVVLSEGGQEKPLGARANKE